MESRSYVPNHEIREKFDGFFKNVIRAMQDSKVTDMNMRSVNYTEVSCLSWFLCSCGVITEEEFKKYMNTLNRVLEDCLAYCVTTSWAEANIFDGKENLS